MNTPQDEFKHVSASAKAVHLTDAERAAVRDRLASFMALTPRRAPWSFRAALYRRAMAVSASVTALALSLAGVSYAAEGTLPGDALYPVKVSVNEEVRAALTTSDDGRAQWEAERAARRLAEAEALAEKGRFTEKAQADLGARFKKQAERAKKAAEKLRDEDESEAADSADARLEGSLRAHGRIIEAIAAKSHVPVTALTVATDDKVDVKEDTKGEAEESRPERKEPEGSVEDVRTENVERAPRKEARPSEDASRKRREALVKRIAAVKTSVEKAEASVGADAFGASKARIAAAEAFMADGAYQEAQRAIQEASVLVKASVGLRLRIDARDGDVLPSRVPPQAPAREDDEEDDRGRGDRRDIKDRERIRFER